MPSNEPVNQDDKHPVEGEDDAEVGILPDSDREGEDHYTDGGNVGGAVQQDHLVHEGGVLCLWIN